jgi:hypothetical protein
VPVSGPAAPEDGGRHSHGDGQAEHSAGDPQDPGISPRAREARPALLLAKLRQNDAEHIAAGADPTPRGLGGVGGARIRHR